MNTGIEGLDVVLNGGLPRGWPYLVRGESGTGRTTLGLQFLLRGVEAGERVLFLTWTHTAAEVATVVASHGWMPGVVPVVPLAGGDSQDATERDQTVFEHGEVELDEARRLLEEALERERPTRLVLDAPQEMRWLTRDPVLYRHHLQSLRRTLTASGATSLLLVNEEPHPAKEVMAHGVIDLQRRIPAHGGALRRLSVQRGSGMRFQEGWHSFRIRPGGLQVFPGHEPADAKPASDALVTSGIEGLDGILHGGVPAGGTVLVSGPPGSGKSTLASHFLDAAAARGERVAAFLFEERPTPFLTRSREFGLGFADRVGDGEVSLRQYDPGDCHPGEFAHAVRRSVLELGASVVLIDSLAGYCAASVDATEAEAEIQGLLPFLARRGVTTLIPVPSAAAGRETMGPAFAVNAADTVLLLRPFEVDGHVRHAVAVGKKRTGGHEGGLHEVCFEPGGVHVGPPLRGLEGPWPDVPRYAGDPAALQAHGSSRP